MARPLRLQFEGAIYHVTSRGDRKLPIFVDDRDRLTFVGKLAETVEQHHWRVYAYVLMPNHYHLLLSTPRPNLSAGMQQFQTSYSSFFRVRHSVCGHVFGGRFKARIVEGDQYLLALARYVHLNPVKVEGIRSRSLAERLAVLRSFPWSSYAGYCAEGCRNAWMEYEPLLALFTTSGGYAGFREYVEAGAAVNDEELLATLAVSSKAIGSPAFMLEAESRHVATRRQVGQVVDVSMRRSEATLPKECVLQVVCAHFRIPADLLLGDHRNSQPRDILLSALRDVSGLSYRQIGRFLGHADGVTVGKRAGLLRGSSDHTRAWAALRPLLTATCRAGQITDARPDPTG